jgi:hypothetical protein
LKCENERLGPAVKKNKLDQNGKQEYEDASDGPNAMTPDRTGKNGWRPDRLSTRILAVLPGTSRAAEWFLDE